MTFKAQDVYQVDGALPHHTIQYRMLRTLDVHFDENNVIVSKV